MSLVEPRFPDFLLLLLLPFKCMCHNSFFHLLLCPWAFLELPVMVTASKTLQGIFRSSATASSPEPS